ncbi:MAG: sterol desaturase family protein [Bacteroidetes bacterium]|nr:sterol desaturase family protein [Bacteroidota bacterium]
MDLWNSIIESYQGYASYLWREITNPGWHNYFYWLIGVSSFFFGLEVFSPWRKNQAKFRKDFWLDFFYMFFNFFLFSLIIYNAASDLVVNFFNNGIKGLTGFDMQASNPMRNFPMWAILLIGFVVRDFVQWWVHRLLHWHPRLWKFHQVHHSVKEMGFAAHLRFHWMETVVYRTIEYIPLALLGIGLYDFFIIHIFSLAVGHYNHSNISVDSKVTGGILGALIGIAIATSAFDIHLMDGVDAAYRFFILIPAVLIGAFLLGPVMKKLFNSPEMHIWHHAYDLPEEKKYGVNFGLSLAIWDYLFGTAYIPHDGRDIKLGFPGVEEFPEDFKGQVTYGFGKEKE